MASISERWRPVTGFENEYEVSDQGRVRSHGRNVNGFGGTMRWRDGRVLALRKNTQGYARAALCRDGRRRDAFVHVLVAAAFLGPKPSGKDVNHKNGVKHDNRVANLEYVTRGQNLAHAYATGLKEPTYGHSLLTADQVRYVRGVGRTKPARELAAELGCSTSAVWRILNGTTWQHV